MLTAILNQRTKSLPNHKPQAGVFPRVLPSGLLVEDGAVACPEEAGKPEVFLGDDDKMRPKRRWIVRTGIYACGISSQPVLYRVIMCVSICPYIPSHVARYSDKTSALRRQQNLKRQVCSPTPVLSLSCTPYRAQILTHCSTPYICNAHHGFSLCGVHRSGWAYL